MPTAEIARLEALLEKVPANTALTTLETNFVLDALPELLKAARDGEARQAKIDALIIEYCPDEMTPEQIENWAAHQKVAAMKEASRG